MSEHAGHLDTPAAVYRTHKPRAVLQDRPPHTGRYVLECVLCQIPWPCDASRMADRILRPDGDPR